MVKVNLKPKAITKKLLSALPERARDVLTRRYGLGNSGEKGTLEAIGQTYGITRERVRQIENYGIQAIQKSDTYDASKQTFDELSDAVDALGGIVGERDLLARFANDQITRNHFYFLLVVGEPFIKHKEDEQFIHRWHTSKEIAEPVETSLSNLHDMILEDSLVPEDAILKMLANELERQNVMRNDKETLLTWLGLSKVLARNPLGEWGAAQSPNVRAKGIRDFAYLAVKRHGSPMHFREVAEAIKELFGRTAHVATCHNELIKDQRFVLVGRGLYALAEWGYTAGVVKDVLCEILRKHGPLSRDEIIEKVRKERYVKDNTIVVNLQDIALFKRLSDGTYVLSE